LSSKSASVIAVIASSGRAVGQQRGRLALGGHVGRVLRGHRAMPGDDLGDHPDERATGRASDPDLLRLGIDHRHRPRRVRGRHQPPHVDLQREAIPMQLYVIWAALLASHPMIIGVFLFVGPAAHLEIAPVLCLLRLPNAMLSAAVGRLFLHHAPLQTQLIIRGAVGDFEGAPLGVAAAVWLVGILAQLGNFPLQQQ